MVSLLPRSLNGTKVQGVNCEALFANPGEEMITNCEGLFSHVSSKWSKRSLMCSRSVIQIRDSHRNQR